jgi:hypothetical protein
MIPKQYETLYLAVTVVIFTRFVVLNHGLVAMFIKYQDVVHGFLDLLTCPMYLHLLKPRCDQVHGALTQIRLCCSVGGRFFGFLVVPFLAGFDILQKLFPTHQLLLQMHIRFKWNTNQIPRRSSTFHDCRDDLLCWTTIGPKSNFLSNIVDYPLSLTQLNG